MHMYLLRAPWCKKCKHWWHIKNFFTPKTVCMLCWRKQYISPNTDVKKMLWWKYQLLMDIYAILWDDIFDVIKSFSSFGVLLKKTKWAERKEYSRLWHFHKRIHWSKLSVTLRDEVLWWDIISWEDAHTLFTNYYI